MKKAFVTGITGQDGAYLAELLLSKGYEVHGLVRRSSTADVNDHRLRWLGVADRVHLVDGDLTDLSGLIRTMKEVMPDEVYNLAAQSFVKSSWQQPLLTGTVTGLGTANMLEAVRLGTARGALLPGVVVGDVRADPGAGAERDDALLSPLALCGRQALRPLDDGELSRELRPARLERHPVQSRIARCAASSSSPARSRTRWRASSSAWPTNCASATSTPSATGATRATMCGPCG